MRIHTITLGCQMSVADGELLARPWLDQGFVQTARLDDADAVIVNTCTVRQHAEDRAVSLIGRLKGWKEGRPGRRLVVAGCAAERVGDWLRRRFKHIDLVVGARSIEAYPGLLEASGILPSPRGAAASPAAAEISAKVTVMRGCNHACAYCIVPEVRGPERHRPMAAVVDEVRAKTAGGAKEILLLGQTVNGYRCPDGGGRFPDLLRAVSGVEGLQRVRFTSPHPIYVDEPTARAMAECGPAAPHLHLPAQSGSDRILKAMRRGHDAEGYLRRVGLVRDRIPDLALTTDIIVGFPGETAADFRDTLRFVERADFCSAYCAKYSPRAGTAAASLDDDVPKEVKEARLAELLDTVEAGMRRHLRALAGKRVRILLESPLEGRTQYHFRARLSQPRRAGEMVPAEVTGCSKTALKARAV